MQLAAAAAALLLLPSSAAAGVWGEGSARPVERSLQTLTGTFAPLTCNTASIDDDAGCGAWTFGENPTEQVVVPCNTCVDMSTAPASVTASGGIDVRGRLHFPEGTQVSISTPHLFVQGKLSMSLLDGAIGAEPDVKITMTGDSDQFLVPESTNAAVCPAEGCNVGPKAIVVAGGQLDIDALADTCPTWSYIDNYIDAGMPNPTSGFPVPPSFDAETQSSCTDVLLNSNFDDPSKGEGGDDQWWGNLGATSSVEASGGTDGSSFLRVSRRTDTWQGPYRELYRSVERPCLLPDALYFFRAKVRLDAGADHAGHQSACSQSGSGCPGLRLQYMKEDDYVVWRDLVTVDRAPADGTWFEIAGSFETEAEWVDPSNVFAMVSIDGPEKQIDISVDDFVIELAPASVYPDPNNVCADLASNGDASSGVAYPFRNYVSTMPLMVVDDGGNKVFYAPERTRQYHSLAWELTPGCLVPGSAYTFSAKIKILSTATVIPYLQFKIEKAGQPVDFDRLACPPVNGELGYVECTIAVTFEDKHYNADRITAFLNLEGDEASWTSDAYFDDVSLAFLAGVASGGIAVASGVTPSCYASGAEAVFPSDDLAYDRAQPVTLDTVSDGLINVAENTARIPTTADRDAGAAGQVAFLSRKVEFDGEGGTLTVLGTPGVAQKIKGVGLVGFGQEGVLGRSPIAFAQGGDSAGSLVSKNAIRASKNRCVHLSGTDGIQVTENVAYDTLGHCYALQEGTETGNIFDKNLGAVTRKASVAAAGESDVTDPATFYIPAPQNTWTDNVAGGSQSAGFLFDTASTAAPISFSGNVAHSNLIAGIDTAEAGYNSAATVTLSGTRAYRNTGPGVRLRSSSGIVLDGGSASDNRDGVLVWKSDGVTVENMAITGQTLLYKNLADAVYGTPKLCTGLSDGPAVAGVRVHPNGPGGTVLVRGVSFDGFTVEAGCQVASGGNTGAIALVADDPDLALNYTTKVEATGLSFVSDHSVGDVVTLCGVEERGMYEVVIDDLDASLSPDTAGADPPVTSGKVISEGMSCSTGVIDMVDSCASYCPNDGIVGEGAPPAPAPGPGESGPAGTAVCLENGDFENGLTGWYPGPGSTGAWSQATVVQEGLGGGFAAQSHHRKDPAMSGLWQDIPAATCLSEGLWYEIRADIKFFDNVTLEQNECDPFNMWFGSSEACPFASLILDRNPTVRIDAAPTVGPLATDGGGWQKLYGVFKATADIMQTSINFIVSVAPVGVDLLVDNVAIAEVADASASVGAVDCGSPVVNGDFETGDLRGWFKRGNGNNGVLSAVAGVGGAGTAARHDGDRPERWHGILQLVPQECFTEGSTWTIEAKFRFFDNTGSPVGCDKGNNMADETDPLVSCPVFELAPNGEELTGPLTNADTGDMIVDQWNTIRNTHTIDAAHANYDTRYTWLTINSVAPGYIYEIDDIVMTRG